MSKRLWGQSKVEDAEVIEGNFLNGNENLPQEGTQLAFLPEHFIEIERCRESIQYFAENYYTILLDGNKKGLMELWDIQKEALDFIQSHNRVVLNSSRQTSKTTMVVLIVIWNMLFGEGLQNIGLLGNKMELAASNLKKIKESFEYLPLFLKPFVTKWNEGEFILKGDEEIGDNNCRITSTTSTAFRGSALNCLIIDEAAFINEGSKADLDSEILQSLLPTLEAAGDNSFCILVSTPYGMNNEFARKFHQSKNEPETTPFRHFEILWSDHPNRDQEWYDKKILEMGSEEAFYVEFGGSFTMGDNIKRIIDGDVKRGMEGEESGTIKEPIFTQNKDLSESNTDDDHSLKIWEMPQKDRIYIAGVDVAEGVGGCYSTIEVFDITDLYDIRQVAEYRNNEIILARFPLVCLKVFNSYNQCYAAVESNNCGREIVTSLTIAHGYKKLIRYHYNPDSNKRMIENDEFGVVSHNNAKNMSVSNCQFFLNYRKAITIRSQELLDEMNGFIRTDGKGKNHTWAKTGGKGSYDDLVDAVNWALLPLHQKLVEQYFELDNPKFDDSAKPRNILKELQSGSSDQRRHNLQMPINNSSVERSLYFGGSLNVNVDIGFDMTDWLQNM